MIKLILRIDWTKLIFCAAILSFAAVLLILHRVVHLYGDDFVYGSYTIHGLETFIARHTEHYMHTNGRAIVHVIVSLILMFDIHLWRILNPFLILLTAGAIARAATGRRVRETPFAFVLSVALFSLLSITMTSQSVYWLTGSINYLYPVAMLFACYICFAKTLREVPKRRIWLSILAFLAGATVEQAGLMVVGILTADALFYWAKEKNLPPASHIAAIIAAVIGYATVVFAPGTFVRQSLETMDLSFTFEGLRGIVNAFVLHDATALFHALICLSCILWLLLIGKKRRGIDLILSLVFFVLGTFFILWYANSPLAFKSLFRYDGDAAFALSCLYLMLTAYVLVRLMLRNGDHVPLMFFAAGLGAIIMLVASPELRERTMFAPLLAFFVPIVSSAQTVIGRIKRENIKAAACLVLAAIAVFSFYQTYEGYRQNDAANRENLRRIQESQRTGDQGVLFLLPMVDDTYAHNPLWGSNYHLSWMKEFYGLLNPKIIIEYDHGEAENRVFVNGERAWLNMNPRIEYGMPLLPIGELNMELGYEVSWNPANRTATLTNENTRLYITVGERIVTLNGEMHELPRAVWQFRDRVIIPADFLGAALGYEVSIELNENGGFDVHFDSPTLGRVDTP